MQHGDFATKISEIATKFSYLVAKLRLDFFLNFEPCGGASGVKVLTLMSSFSQFVHR